MTEEQLTMIEYPNGSKEWYLYGLKHRIDGPAIENANGSKQWWLNGERHRAGGPAVELADGRKEWYLNGKLVTAQDVFWAAAQSGNAAAMDNIIENYAEELSK